jgi:hypothetical protein
MESDDLNRMMKLIERSASEQYSEEEIQFLKSVIPKKKFKVKYCIYRQERYNGLYIAFVIDSDPGRTRQTAFFQGCEMICERELSDDEYHEEIVNFGCNNRVLTVWHYKDTNQLVQEDLKYGVKTPEEFIKEFKYREQYGFTKEQQREYFRQYKPTRFRAIH